jgi:hypothetical protein
VHRPPVRASAVRGVEKVWDRKRVRSHIFGVLLEKPENVVEAASASFARIAASLNSFLEATLGFGMGLVGRHAGVTPGLADWVSFSRAPAILMRFSKRAFTATTSVLPDIDSAATSGLSTKGKKTPAASGNATAL